MYRFLIPLSLAVTCVGNVYAQQPAEPSQIQTSALAGNPNPALEPTGILSLQAAIALAVNTNVELSAARYEVEAVGASILQAGARPNPSIDLGMEDTRKETRETTIQLSQAIELGGKRAARIQAAERGRDTATADLRVRQAEIRATTITYYFDVLSAQERVLLSQDALDVARRGSLVASKRVSAGKASPVEETKAKVAEAGVRVELLQARNELTTARKRLSSMWGNLSPRFVSVDGNINELPALPDARTLADRFANAPGMSRARNEVERRQAMALVERTRRIPDVTLTLGTRRSEELGRNQAIFGVSMPIPVFDTNRGNILESLRRVDKARDELTQTQIRLDTELSFAYERLATLGQEAQALQTEVLPGAQSAYTAASTGFEFGKFAFLDVLDAQRTLLSAKSQYLRTLSEAHRAAAEIDRILGASQTIPKQ